MPAEIRRTLLHVENTLIEAGRPASPPLKMIAACAIVKNPWAGMGYVEDLQPAIKEVAPGLGEILTAMVLDQAGSGDAVEGYGKAAICGMGGEVEHASALIHTLQFGNRYREAVGAKTYLSFTNLRGGPATPIMIPLMDKHDAGRRSHYLTIHFSIPDAPHEDEIIIALGASVGGRPNHRIGDRYQDLKIMGGDVDNPAGV